MSDLQRVIFALVGMFFAFGPLAWLTGPNGFRSLGIVAVLAYLPFLALGGYLVWGCLFSETLVSGQRDPKEDSSCPKYSPDALVCQFGPGQCSIIIDRAAKRIHFQNCHKPRKFLAAAPPWFSCPFDDMLAAYRLYDRGGGYTLQIITKLGTASVPTNTTSYDQLVQLLTEVIPINRHIPLVDNPLGAKIGLGTAAMCGLFAGWLAPKDASTATLGLVVLGGSVFGLFAWYQSAGFVDRILWRDNSANS